MKELELDIHYYKISKDKIYDIGNIINIYTNLDFYMKFYSEIKLK